jgi:hypothetical protein
VLTDALMLSMLASTIHHLNNRINLEIIHHNCIISNKLNHKNLTLIDKYVRYKLINMINN